MPSLSYPTVLMSLTEITKELSLLGALCLSNLPGDKEYLSDVRLARLKGFDQAIYRPISTERSPSPFDFRDYQNSKAIILPSAIVWLSCSSSQKYKVINKIKNLKCLQGASVQLSWLGAMESAEEGDQRRSWTCLKIRPVSLHTNNQNSQLKKTTFEKTPMRDLGLGSCPTLFGYWGLLSYQELFSSYFNYQIISVNLKGK